MKAFALILIATLLTGCGTAAYQQYDRTHQRRVDVSYDQDTDTFDLGYTITPLGGYAK